MSGPAFAEGLPETGRRPWHLPALLLAVLTALALGHVGVRGKQIDLAYDLGRERLVNEALRDQERRLKIEIGVLKDPDRVARRAADELGLGPPEAGALRVLPKAAGAGP